MMHAAGLNPKEYGLSHIWMKNRKPNQIANNVLKYQRIDAVRRAALRDQWNDPVLWPLAAATLVLAVFGLVARGAWRRRERGKGRLDVGT